MCFAVFACLKMCTKLNTFFFFTCVPKAMFLKCMISFVFLNLKKKDREDDDTDDDDNDDDDDDKKIKRITT